MYRDDLVGDDELSASSSDCSIFDTLAGKLLAAADKYELPRLRVLCESYLCKQISVNSVATTLALADQHHATELKSVCLKFAAENLSGNKTLQRMQLCVHVCRYPTFATVFISALKLQSVVSSLVLRE